MSHRKVWVKHNGKIPKDAEGRSYEIHHKDGNRKNNNIDNLICLTIQEHYQIHLKQRDYAAAALISKRMNISPNHMSDLQRGVRRTKETCDKIAQSKLGSIPWNKGIKGYKLNCERKNKRFNSKLSLKDVEQIKTDFANQVLLDDMGKIGKKSPNGKYITYKTLFANQYSVKYNVTSAAIRKIITNQTWKEGVFDVRTKT